MSLPNQLAKKVTAAWSFVSGRNTPLATLALVSFLLPTQLGRHFWPDWAFVSGLRSDYLSPTIYLTDILIVFLFLQLGLRYLLSRWQGRSAFSLPPAQRAYSLLSFGLVLIAIFSIYPSVNPASAWWHVGKLTEFVLFGGVAGWFLRTPGTRKTILAAFLLGAFLQSAIALGQFFLGHDLGLWILGERSFSGETLGVAQAVVEGKLLLRSYGTLPHPNVLAFLMLLASNVVLALTLKEKNFKLKTSLGLAFVIFSLALLTSLSRLAIVLWLASSTVIFITLRKNGNRKELKLASILAVSVAGLLLFSPLSSWFSVLSDADSQTVAQRLNLSADALSLIKEHPLSGIGIGNFVARLPDFPSHDWVRFIQPAHNIYLLVGAEVGIIGLAFWLSLVALGLWRVWRIRHWLLIVIVAEILAVAFFDHYFWSLQQGGLIFWSIIGGLFSPMVGPEVIPARPPAAPSS